MSNYNNTKATIAANVYTNHANQVTADMVKTAINAVVDTIIAGGFLYKGVAIPTTNPGSPDANVAYIAATAGTYTNFGGLVVADGEVAVLKYNGSWSKEVTGAATAAQVSALGQKVSELGIVTDDTYEDCLYVSDAFGNTILKVDVKGIKALGVETKEIKTIDDNYPAFSVTDNNGNIIFQLDARCGFLDLVERTRNNKLSVPAVSWIDDDFLVDDAGGNLTPNYAALHTWCITNNIRMDFALIDDASKVNRVHQFEKENFRFLLHPKHQGWYNDPVEGNTHNIATVKESLAENISFFKANNINSDCKIIVWPGDSDTFPDNMEVVGNYCECGIKATLEDCNFGNKNNRFALRRLSIIPSSDRPKSLIKDEIRSCLEQGGWVILYTHFYECDITITTPDETSNSVVNVLEIAGYANDLCKIRNTEAIWAERKIMYNL